MKKHILSFVLATALIGAIATGCSSAEKAGGSDTTATDTTMMTTPSTTDTTMTTPATTDTTKTDTVKM